MSTILGTYTRLIIVLGLSVLVAGLRSWQCADPLQYACYLILAVLASTLKVGLSTEQGRFSVSILFILVAIVSLGPSEMLLLAAAVGFMQAVAERHEVKPSLERVLYSISVLTIAASIADTAVHAPLIEVRGQSPINSAIRLMLVGTAFFVGQSFPEATREALEKNSSMGLVWKSRWFWRVPYYVGAAATAGIFQQANQSNLWQVPVLLTPVLYLIYRSYRLYIVHSEDRRNHAEEMASLHLRTIEALALAIDAKDHTTHDHLKRVQIYAVEIGKEMGLGLAELDALRAASLLHDIGKLAVPEHIISKPGKLTPEEFDRMKIHPVVGAEILERVRFPYPVVPIVRHHHEKWDGSGYPDRLKGDQIPVGARILATVDCLDALASDRQYRKAMPIDQAMGVIVAEAGRSFDPRIVEILARRYLEFEEIARNHEDRPFRLNTGIRVEAGEAPAAGFEHSDRKRPPLQAAGHGPDFLLQIAAAREEGQALFELAQHIGNSLSLDDTLSVLAVRLKKLVPFDALAVYLKRDGDLIPEFVSGENFRLFAALRIPLGQGLSGWVAENSKPIVNGNPSVEPGYLNDPGKFSTLRSALAVPLDGLNGVVGVLALYHGDKDAYDKDHLRILQAISSKLSLAVENSLRYRQAETSATTDYLTELPNARSLFLHLETEIARCKEREDSLCVLVGDLDGFKEINDHYGHLEGNRLLKVVAQTLRGRCRQQDYVARMGGDEFVLVLPGLAAETLERRINVLAEACRDEARMQTGLDVTISIGSALFPADGTDAESLLKAADRRMYATKAERANALHQVKNSNVILYRPAVVNE